MKEEVWRLVVKEEEWWLVVKEEECWLAVEVTAISATVYCRSFAELSGDSKGEA